MRKGVVALGVVVGAGMMYIFDPSRGRSRRARIRDKAYGTLNDLSKDVGHTVRNFGNRVEGLLAETAGLLRSEPASDDVLVARIRSKLGRIVRRPHGITVAASDGNVRVEGTLPAAEIAKVEQAIRSMSGVATVDNRLEARDESTSAEESHTASAG